MSPVASSPRRSSVKSSPQKNSPRKPKSDKKQPTLAELPEVPSIVLRVLEEAQITNFAELSKVNKSELLKQYGEGLKEENEALRLVKIEFFGAWIECLMKHAGDGSISLAEWRKNVNAQKLNDVLLTDNSIENKNSKEGKEGKVKLSRGQLVRQRQALKKSKGTRINVGIVKATELREVKGRLTHLPLGKALSKSVSLDSLQAAKAKLRKSNK